MTGLNGWTHELEQLIELSTPRSASEELCAGSARAIEVLAVHHPLLQKTLAVGGGSMVFGRWRNGGKHRVGDGPFTTDNRMYSNNSGSSIVSVAH